MELLASDPWFELIDQASCDILEAEPIQPPQSDLNEIIKYLRASFAAYSLKHAPLSQKIFKITYRSANPLADALIRSLASGMGKSLPPESPQTAPLPIGDMCQIALLRGSSGESLARNLLPLLSFPTLWCPESEYRRKETEWSISLLLRAFGKFTQVSGRPDPYFTALAKVSPRFDEGPAENGWGAVIHRGEKVEMALVNQGSHVPLGAMRAESIEIPAFGPQSYPLNESAGFGIRRTLPSIRFAAAAARPDVWFEVHTDLAKGRFETRFFGVEPEAPLAFAFYLKADSAEIGGIHYKPQSLQRYFGPNQKAVFRSGESSFSIENQIHGKMELIPLAGDQIFWGAHFLLAFEIPPFDGRASFLFD